MDANEKKVEAILFAVGKGVTAERITSLCSLEIKVVEKILNNLKAKYDQDDNALKIVKQETSWKLTVLDELVPLVSSIVTSTEFEQPLMETLAVIAWKYPLLQSEIIKLRGSGAYDHMRQLKEQGFIAKEKFGRSYKVKLTKKFFEYFDLPSEETKHAFLQQIPTKILEEAEEVNKEADEVERLIELDQKEKNARQEIKQALDKSTQ